MAGSELDQVLEKLAKDIESAVHSLYRGEVRQNTAQSRTGSMLREAKAAAAAAAARGGAPGGAEPRSATPASAPRASTSAPAIAGGSVGWSREEGEAVLKCITAWLPMGPPNSTPPDSKCIAAMRDLTPNWAQREKAREAVKRISQP